ncbi:hypothetical protein [Croceicoccus pelagius]|uniref:Uncharacterized protein n=1 Tax=Croceicoccus pelagius TaxID=1703341 RepID=A0A916Y7E4_9SPHN|nr:hypothetical protein [Croceicoccus pelagius]GGD32381.1 hypothetical protein GCM10010989_03030 [Croceicoccus pelagius]
MIQKSEAIKKVILEVEDCLHQVDMLGLRKAGAILETALVELQSISQSLDAFISVDLKDLSNEASGKEPSD